MCLFFSHDSHLHRPHKRQVRRADAAPDDLAEAGHFGAAMAGKKAKGKKKPSKAAVSSAGKGEVEDVPSPRETSALISSNLADEVNHSTLLANANGATLTSLSHPSSSGSGVPRAAVFRVRKSCDPNGLRESASAASGTDSRVSNGPGGTRDGEWRRKLLGERERDKKEAGEREREKEKGPGDECHNGERLGRSPLVCQSAEKEWSWLAYSAKQFRLFAQEFPPTLDIRADEVSFFILIDESPPDNLIWAFLPYTYLTTLEDFWSSARLPVAHVAMVAICTVKREFYPLSSYGLTRAFNVLSHSSLL